MQLKSFLQSQLDHIYFKNFAKELLNVIPQDFDIEIKMKCSNNWIVLTNESNKKSIEFIIKEKHTYEIECENVYCYSDIFNEEEEHKTKIFTKLFQAFIN
jgi:hypothetical protein